ncbi:MAG TPA: adenylate/guanylate cyclase domain-containing protein [Burkholderiales bacterium]|nr:adenylate/guanylate cyclase domain-containing protein [Burkholderiales bacterium]
MSVRVTPSVLLRRLGTAGVLPSDPEEIQLKKHVLLFSCGLMIGGSAIWLGLYHLLGLPLSATLPFGVEVVSLGTLLVYLWTLNFNFFRVAQLSLWLFVPFVVQWAMGDFVSASGMILWGLLAPVGAALLLSARESLPWMVAYVVLTAATGYVDHELAGAVGTRLQVPVRTTVVFFALNFAAVCAMVYWLLSFAFTERERSRARLQDAHARLLEEQERSERLLLNILPAPIAERLKKSEAAIADGYADVSVMFADIVNFTRLAEDMAPRQVFALLNRMFSEFDALAERFGLEKIKTIGDAYMVAGGLNLGNAEYSGAIAELALEIRDLVARDFQVDGRPLALRIGIGSGPVVAGVVGKKKFIYDLWGDTVNIASRITAEGAPGMIQVDQATYKRLRDKYEFLEPQTIYLKGKGDTTVYRMIGRRDAVRREAV